MPEIPTKSPFSDPPLGTIYYGVFESDGTPKAFYNTDIYPPQENGDRHAKIPAEAIEITQAQWQELLSNPLARLVNGTIVYVEPPPLPPPVPNPVMLEAERANQRLDDGVTAAVTGATTASRNLRTLPPHSTPPTVEELQAQIDYLAAETQRMADSYTAMVQAQVDPQPKASSP